MTLRCPACGKTNELSGSAPCPRCGCDLSTLYVIRRAAALHLAHAAAGLRAEDWGLALAHAERSWELMHTLPAARLALLAASALADSDRVWHWLPLAWGQSVQPPATAVPSQQFKVSRSAA